MTSNYLTRRKISTAIKLLCYLNLLPEKYAKQLHKSQLSRYKNHFDCNEYFGYELRDLELESIKKLQQINKYNTDRKVISAYLRLASLIRSFCSENNKFKKILHKNRKSIVRYYLKYKTIININNLSKILKLSDSTIRNWVNNENTKCNKSIINKCFLKHPNQLRLKEISLMEKLLTSKEMIFWPLASVYHYALKNNIVSMGKSTWYKYCDKLGIKRPKRKSLKVKKEGIKAKHPNQYWHADVTYFNTRDGQRHYIYLVVDNFSRKIISWAVSVHLRAHIRLKTFIDAVDTAKNSFFNNAKINLIVDGGSENNNKTVDAFISSLSDVQLKKEIALKTVTFSNSMAEATNKIIKNDYLGLHTIPDTSSLEATLEKVITDFNNNRPHDQLKGLTPTECYAGAKVNDDLLSLQKQEARQKRIEENKNRGCC